MFVYTTKVQSRDEISALKTITNAQRKGLLNLSERGVRRFEKALDLLVSRGYMIDIQ